MGISYLVGTVVGRARALDERKAGCWVGLPGALTRSRYAPGVAVGIPLRGTLEARDAYLAEKYWTEVGDQIGAREQCLVPDRIAHWCLALARSWIGGIQAPTAVAAFRDSFFVNFLVQNAANQDVRESRSPGNVRTNLVTLAFCGILSL